MTKSQLFCKGTEQDIKDSLQIELNSIKRASDKCIELAKDVEKKFDGLMKLTKEISEVSTAARGSHEEQVQKAGRLYIK